MIKDVLNILQRYFTLMLISIITLQITGCSFTTPILVGGTVLTANIVSDRRTAGSQIEDSNIYLKIKKKLFNSPYKKEINRIKFTIYNRQVLITGEVNSDDIKKHITKMVANIDGITNVKNYLKIRPALNIENRLNDKIILYKLKLIFLTTKDIPSKNISITVDQGSVFLMGLVTKKEGNKVSSITSKIHGVNRVIKNFEYK
ncbi:hypothetical protein CKSOR_00629 [Candidatus Kinetoplastibacterium sorsogonicusi]|uniref:BON domain-containing protein n=1 Tax=Candidatus Kinetoplastidibacterium kentomonadis TaxID=1576550 RepID=A0A3S7JAN4_9PROT|nr:BON domain-containing protein [Candidatus Kinetoplastibacterium sorsogonicusi]AWD32730.1 hypothetical protein CKSOR_00629 [Candidatus Kinetoplastibacterium sorsogonicusi]